MDLHNKTKIMLNFSVNGPEESLSAGSGVDAGIGHPDGPGSIPNCHLHVPLISCQIIIISHDTGSLREYLFASSAYLILLSGSVSNFSKNLDSDPAR